MSQRPARTVIASIALWFALVFVAALALYGTRPPPVVDATAPPNSFSAVRAMTHLAQIAKQPHPIGSDEATRVRAYLIEQLRGLGGEVHVEQSVGTVYRRRSLYSGLVNNIVATFPGQSNSRAVMLVAHYDSVAEGPGAADDGAGLIVILEAIRALRSDSPIKNDLVVLFSDGEEAHGLLGARAFVNDHPDIASRTGMMVNLEARGDSGPGLMFETSDGNGALIRAFAQSATYPMATSLMAAIYRLLPNDTDFTPLKAAGLTGFNFAFLEHYQAYHTRLDTIENLDPRSVQHVGANVLGLVRHFGNLEQPPAKKRDLVYFNWFGSRLLVYPIWFAWAIALLAPILFAVYCIRSASRLELTLRRTIAGAGIFFLQFLIMVGGSFAAYTLARLVAREFLEGDTLSNQLLFTGVMGMAFGLALGTQHFLRNKLGLENIATGQLFAVSLLTLIVCWFLVGGSYVLQWPLLFAMAGMFFGRRFTGTSRSVCHFVFLVPALLILIPLAYLLFVGLLFSYVTLAAVSFVLAVLLAMALPLFDRLAVPLKFNLTVLFLISISLIGAGVRLSVPDARHPRRDTLVYSVNADEKKAKWVSYDAVTDHWTSRFLPSTRRSHPDPAYTVGLERPVLSSDAKLVPLEQSLVTKTQDFVRDGERTVTLQIVSRRNARSFLVRLPRAVVLAAAGWNGTIEPIHDTSQTDAPWTFRFFNPPPEGVSLEFRFLAQNSIRVWIADITPGLPEIEPVSTRPDDTTPEYGSDTTLVAATPEF